ncbi:MAG: geranylgeranylglycerol-phosphate geranylgeranyltransferase [Saprospiraceae bacterium]|nr:geranylgeranylglycerol-phosphate geranylgeranyltransferase [Saprospiraceae bacterium]
MALLRLIRFPNLLIVILTQFLLFELIRQTFDQANIELVLSLQPFSYLVFVTVLITAAGYIVNDILDLSIDRINKPHKVIIGKRIRVASAYWLYFICFLVGFIISLYLAYYVKRLYLLSIFPIAFMGLFLYSSRFKKLPLIGNFTIAVYCAGVAGILLLAEQSGLRELAAQQADKARFLKGIFYWYMAFAFLSTMFREIVKDMEDIKGDQSAGCRTLPIQAGMQVTRWVATAFGVSLLILVPWMSSQIPFLAEQTTTWVFLGLAIMLPILVALVLLWRAQEKRHFHRLSQLAKFIMFTGILFLIFILIR